MNDVMQETPKLIIESTTDYGVFKIVASNREINEAHVKKLMEAISNNNLLDINPIVVNSNMEVIDGQHRLEAATRLGIPVYYLKSDKVSKNNIADLNSLSKKWMPIDYINYWTVEGLPHYATISRFLNSFPEFNVTIALSLLDGSDAHDPTAYKTGRANANNYEEAVKLAEIIKSFSLYIDFAFRQNFVLAIKQIVSTGKYDHKLMLSKLDYQSRSLVKCVNKKQYVELIEEIYNFKTREDNRVRFI